MTSLCCQRWLQMAATSNRGWLHEWFVRLVSIDICTPPHARKKDANAYRYTTVVTCHVALFRQSSNALAHYPQFGSTTHHGNQGVYDLVNEPPANWAHSVVCSLYRPLKCNGRKSWLSATLHVNHYSDELITHSSAYIYQQCIWNDSLLSWSISAWTPSSKCRKTVFY